MSKLSALSIAAIVAVVALVVAVTHTDTSGAGSDPPAEVTVDQSVVGRPIPAGFVGLSTELSSLYSYTGTDPKAINPVFEQLVENLAPGQRPVFRLGGDTTDSTWWPGHHKQHPLGIRYGLTSRWLHVAHALAEGINPGMLIGINLESDRRTIAGAEAHAIVTGIGSKWIQGLELGNEPELYGGLAWFVLNGRKYYGRPHSYNFHDFVRDFSRISKALGRAPLAGPNIGSPHWFPYLGAFLRDEPRVRVATLHRYPLKKCSASAHRTIGELLANYSSRGLANTVRRWVGVAHAHHVPVRIDEMNAVSCGGQPGVSNVFGSALWAVDALFEMARVGVDGVNIHTRPGVSGELFSFRERHRRWQAKMHPEYYGLMMFAQAAPAGSRLLRIAGSAGGQVKIWATRATDGRVRVVLINKSQDRRRDVTIRVDGATSTATLERLLGPSASATSGVTLDGRRIGTERGVLVGPPAHLTVRPHGGRFLVALPAASAAMLTLSAS
jgi:Glycosyl hydrolase family 79 C-terminal beta domain